MICIGIRAGGPPVRFIGLRKYLSTSLIDTVFPKKFPVFTSHLTKKDNLFALVAFELELKVFDFFFERYLKLFSNGV